jgi:chaperonin GroEL
MPLIKHADVPKHHIGTGAQLLKEAMTRLDRDRGDGVATMNAILLAMLEEILRYSATGVNTMVIRTELDRAIRRIVSALDAQAIPVEDPKTVTRVAVTASGNERIGEVVGNALETVGPEGAVLVEELEGAGIAVEYIEGVHYQGGYLSLNFVNDLSQQKAVAEQPYLLITNRKISDPGDLLPALEAVSQAGGKALVVIAAGVTEDALTLLLANDQRGEIRCMAGKAPSFQQRRREELEDIAILTGGYPFLDTSLRKLSSVTLEDLGRAKKAEIGQKWTSIIGGGGSTDAILDRVKQLERAIETAVHQFDKDKYRERIGRLYGGIAVIRVDKPARGQDRLEIKRRVEDALTAAKAARDEGIVPGGGVALLRAVDALNGIDGESVEEMMALNILRRGLQAPILRLAASGGRDPRTVLNHMDKRQQESGEDACIGYDVISDDFVDVWEKGIVDPLLVVRGALTTAGSVASLMLTTGAVVADVTPPEPEEPRPTTSPALRTPGMLQYRAEQKEKMRQARESWEERKIYGPAGQPRRSRRPPERPKAPPRELPPWDETAKRIINK